MQKSVSIMNSIQIGVLFVDVATTRAKNLLNFSI